MSEEHVQLELAKSLISILPAMMSDDLQAFTILDGEIQQALPSLGHDDRQILIRAAGLVLLDLVSDISARTGEQGYEVIERTLLSISSRRSQ